MLANNPQPTPCDGLLQRLENKQIILSVQSFTLPSEDDQKHDAQKSREEYLKNAVPLYQAALDGDWKMAKGIFEGDMKWMTAKITKYGDTALHIAAAAMHLEFVKELAKLMCENLYHLESTNLDNNTAFCNAAASGNVEIAKVMVGFNSELPNKKGARNLKMIPLHMAILLGKRNMVNYLKEVTDLDRLEDDYHIELLTNAIEAGLYDVALFFIEKNPKLALKRNSKNETVLHTLAAQRPIQNSTCKRNIWGKLLRQCNKDREQEMADALKITRIAWNEVIKNDENVVSILINSPWRLLFVAAKSGNVEFLRTLILLYPDVIRKVDEKRRTIFHVAVKYRHEEIFKLIHEFGSMRDLIARYMDDQGNNMLHLAAKLPPPERLNCASGAALQMQRELIWFEAVKKVVQPRYAMAKNHKEKLVQDNVDRGEIENKEDTSKFKSTKTDEERSESLTPMQNNEDQSESFKSIQNDDKNSESKNVQEYYIEYEDDEEILDFGMTPQALFTKQHEDLRSRGELWMKKTAESCTLVATLITTVIFTAAFTLPGGNDQSNGSPILLNQVCFKVFAIFNAVALFASSTSIFMFLSILTSRYAEEDFLEQLPCKLMGGLTSLFISIASMMAAFTAAFFITFLRNSIWIPVPIAILAAIPVVLFLLHQSPLLWDIYRFKNQSWTLIQPSDKRTLFWSSKRPKIMSNNMERPSCFNWRRLHNKLE